MKLLLLLCGALPAATASAQIGTEIARQHAERAGDRLAALRTLRTEGRIFINGETLPFVTLAGRPNRLRVESGPPLRRVIQGYDGANPPWISHAETHAGVPAAMPPGDAQDFLVDADFDGPLVDFARKGYSVDYAGEDMLDGRRAFKLLLMGRQDEIFFLWVDAASHEVVKRLVYRTNKNRRVSVETCFKDFRPVAGVLLPYRIETSANGELLYAMVIDRMEPNVALPPGTFERPQRK